MRCWNQRSKGHGPDNKFTRLAGLLICLLAGGCMQHPSDVPYASRPDINDYSAREDCLYRTLCSEIHRRGTGDLEGAASYAGRVCELPISQKMMQHAASTGGQSAMNEDLPDERMAELEFDWHAMALAQQLKDRCGAPQ
jgi:hypothetical protein